MTPEQFCFWLQGWSEMEDDEVPSPEQWKMIKEHLSTVFNKVTPPLTMPSLPKNPWDSPPTFIC